MRSPTIREDWVTPIVDLLVRHVAFWRYDAHEEVLSIPRERAIQQIHRYVDREIAGAVDVFRLATEELRPADGADEGIAPGPAITDGWCCQLLDQLAKESAIIGRLPDHMIPSRLEGTRNVALYQLSSRLVQALARADRRARLDEHRILAALDEEGRKQRYFELANEGKSKKGR